MHVCICGRICTCLSTCKPVCIRTCIWLFICICIWLPVCSCTRMYLDGYSFVVYIYVHVLVYLYVCIQVYVDASRTCIHIHIDTHMHRCIYIHSDVHAYVHTHVCIYIYSICSICIHTYTTSSSFVLMPTGKSSMDIPVFFVSSRKANSCALRPCSACQEAASFNAEQNGSFRESGALIQTPIEKSSCYHIGHPRLRPPIS